MVTLPPEEWIDRRHEEIVASAGIDGIHVKALIDQLNDELASAIERGDVEVPATRAWVAQRVKYYGDNRKRELDDELPTFVEAVIGDTILGSDDPILDLALPVGGDEKLRKSLRYCSVDDLESMVRTRWRNGAAAMAKAQEFADNVDPVIDTMRQRGVRIVNDLI